jgi:flagellar hook-associated protein 3 FlgL
MRVSFNLMSNNVLGNLFRNSERLLNAQKTVATGKIVNKPSDDPIAMGEILDYRKILSSIEQYKTNIVKGKSRIDVSLNVLDSVSKLLTDAKNIAVDQSASGSENDNREIAAIQIKEIRDQIYQLANTKLLGRYIFAGYESDKPAFLNDGSYDGDSGDINIIVGDNLKANVNATGDEVFISSSGANVFTILDNLQASLEADPYVQSDISDQIKLLDGARDQVNNVSAMLASKHTMMEFNEEKLKSIELNIEDMRSDVEDADMAEAIVSLQLQQTAYEVALAASSKLIQQSFMDFMR